MSIRVPGIGNKTRWMDSLCSSRFRESGVNEEGNCAVWTFCIDTGKRDEKKKKIERGEKREKRETHQRENGVAERALNLLTRLTVSANPPHSLRNGSEPVPNENGTRDIRGNLPVTRGSLTFARAYTHVLSRSVPATTAYTPELYR